MKTLFIAAALALFAGAPLMAQTLPAPLSRPDPAPRMDAKEGELPEPVQATSAQRIIATQNRVNRYFHKTVMPRLSTCWAGLKGPGTLDVEIGFKRDADRWAAGESRSRGTTLPKGEDEAAFKCLAEAMRDTDFPVEPTDREAQYFQVNWTFPVPFPRDANEAVARMIDTGGGGNGCGGTEGPAPACNDCFYTNLFGIGISYCAKVCVGYAYCHETPNGCNVGPISPMCATGSPFGNIGGITMF